MKKSLIRGLSAVMLVFMLMDTVPIGVRADTLKSSGSNKTYAASYRYTITYVLNGGKNASTNPTGFNKSTPTFKLAKPTRKGYTFKGWYLESNFKTKISEIQKGTKKNITLYAKWAANTYKVVFKGNHSTSGSMSSLTKRKYGTSFTLPANQFKRTSYVFTGWNTKADGSGKSYTDGASVKNLTSTNDATVTLYAQWKSKDKIVYENYRAKVKKVTGYPVRAQLCRVNAKTRTHISGLCNFASMEILLNRRLALDGTTSKFFTDKNLFSALGFSATKTTCATCSNRDGYIYDGDTGTIHMDTTFTSPGGKKYTSKCIDKATVSANVKKYGLTGYLKKLLREHPEGIWVHSSYGSGRSYHAVVVTDYVESGGKTTFRVLDPVDVLNGKTKPISMELGAKTYALSTVFYLTASGELKLAGSAQFAYLVKG